MSVATCHTGNWLASMTQLLDEHHLVILSDDPAARASCCSALSSYLGGKLGIAVDPDQPTELPPRPEAPEPLEETLDEFVEEVLELSEEETAEALRVR